MKKLLFALLIFMCAFHVQAQSDTALKGFRNQYFEISYPKRWEMKTVDNKISFYEDVRMGDITIAYDSIGAMPLDSVRKLIFGNRSEKELGAKVSQVRTGLVEIGTYDYEENGVKYFVKVIQRRKEMFLIVLNWNSDSWEKHKDILLTSYHSFRIR